MLDITKKITNGKVYISLAGHLDVMTSPGFGKELEQLLPEAKELTLDFAQLEYISSAGLRTLLDAIQYMDDHACPMVKIWNANNNIRETFELTGFDEMLDIADDQDQ